MLLCYHTDIMKYNSKKHTGVQTIHSHGSFPVLFARPLMLLFFACLMTDLLALVN